MRNILLLLLFVISSIPVFAQAEISVDKVNEQGERMIGTKSINITGFADKTSLLPSVSAIVLLRDGEKITSLFIDMKIVSLGGIGIPDKGKMLIKLINDEVVTLECEKGQDDYIGSIVKGAGLTSYTIIPMYSATTEQLEQIALQGVKKIRIETTENPIDKEYKKDKMGVAIKNQYALIKEKLATDKKFSDGF